jgi:hypothetical protein
VTDCPKVFIPRVDGELLEDETCYCELKEGHLPEPHHCPECGVSWKLRSETK